MIDAAYIALALLATVGAVLVAAMSLTRWTSRLAAPLALLSLNQFAWNGATAGSLLTGNQAWAWVGATAAPLFPPIALHLVLAFVGRRRALARPLGLAYAVFSAQAIGAAATAVFPDAFGAVGVSFWSATMGVTAGPLAGWGASLLVRHFLSAPTRLERLRTGLVLAALALVALTATTDILHDLGAHVRPLSQVGSFFFSGTLAFVAFRLKLLPLVSDVRSGLFAALVGFGGAVVVLLAFVVFEGRIALLALAFGAISLVATVVVGRAMVAIEEEREGLARFAGMGRFSAQLAHDLKNPLAAAQGAVQFLEEEHRQGRSLEAHASFLTLLAAQLGRMAGTIERYQRLSAVTPVRVPMDVAKLVNQVVGLQSKVNKGGGGDIELTVDLPSTLPQIWGDADLLGTALDNLLKNAREALAGGGGTISVRARAEEGAIGEVVALSVADTGRGMDARSRERAFEPFFTTKADGSGLGLSWVMQVARAHQGHVRLDSTEGRGTTVTLLIPREPPI